MNDIKVSLELVNEILAVLGEQKAKDVFSLIVKIHDVVQKQVLPKETPEKE